MPRFAATMLGLLLVAFSIGFNTMRYPVVWEMVNPTKENTSVAPAAVAVAASPPPKPAEPETPPPTPQPAKPIEVQPVSEVSDTVVANDPKKAEGSASVSAEVVANEDAGKADSEARKPLVPVVPVSSPGTPGDVAVGGAGICRLPPVDPNSPSEAERKAKLLGKSIPFYPTTGIE